MKHLVIGTAGHIDHGKTALVKALTGVDADRLAQEQQRGITIDIGFARMALSGGITADIVDLPGHEKYLKNMLAGAGGIDLALMVVAADEGVMPQTREHRDILELLGVRRGVIVLTRCDLVDAQMRELAYEEARAAFAESFLRDAPVVFVSSVTGEGLEELRDTLAAEAAGLPQRRSDRPLALPIDRSFTMQGFGTVVTGTVTQGSLSVGETVYLCPAGLSARVRGLQSGGESINTVFAGQRAAVNLIGVKPEQARRGGLLSSRTQNSTLLDVRLDALPSARTLPHGARLHLAIGTAQVVCRLILFGTDALAPDRSAYAQLRLEEPVAARPTDRFVVRFFSPVETVGGGVVLDAAPVRHKRSDSTVRERLRRLDTGSDADCLLELFAGAFLLREEVRERFWHLADIEFDTAWQTLLQSGTILPAGPFFSTPAHYTEIGRAILKTLGGYHAAHPLADGMPLSALQGLYPADLLGWFARTGLFRREGAAACLPTFSPLQTTYGQLGAQKLFACYEAAGCAPPPSGALAQEIGLPQEDCARILSLLQRQGQLVQATPEYLFFVTAIEQARAQTRYLAQENGGATIATLRDGLGITRKYAQVLLEYFDRIGYTVKDGDLHRLAGSDGGR